MERNMKEKELVRALEGLLELAHELHKGVHVCDSGCEDTFENAELVLAKSRGLAAGRNGDGTREQMR